MSRPCGSSSGATPRGATADRARYSVGMKPIRILFVSSLLATLAACSPSAPLTIPCPGTVEPTPECACDCPDGPPPDGQISTFCQDPANNCTADNCPPCCLGPSRIGKCVNLECVGGT